MQLQLVNRFKSFNDLIKTFSEAVKLAATYAEHIGDKFAEQLLSLMSYLKTKLIRTEADLFNIEISALSRNFQKIYTALILL